MYMAKQVCTIVVYLTGWDFTIDHTACFIGCQAIATRLSSLFRRVFNKISVITKVDRNNKKILVVIKPLKQLLFVLV